MDTGQTAGNRPVIEAAGLTKLYGARVALRRVDLLVPAGHVLAVLGPNGSGKTTLVRLLATLTRPSAGRAALCGHDVVRARDRVRQILAVVGHATHLYYDLTARENLGFAVALTGRRPEAARIQAALQQVGLEEHGHSRVRELSSGMRRRVALARALLREPRVMLLDEPFAGLDHESTKRLEDRLHAFRAGGGTALLVTHSVARALAVADQVLIIAGGRVAGHVPRAELTEAGLRELYVAATEPAESPA